MQEGEPETDQKSFNGLTISELKAEMESIPMFESSLEFVGTVADLTPRELAALVKRLGLDNMISLSTMDRALEDLSTGVEKYASTRGYSAETIELIKSMFPELMSLPLIGGIVDELKMELDARSPESDLSQIVLEIDETLKPEILSGKTANEAFEFMTQKPLLSTLLDELSVISQSDQYSELVSRNVSIQTFEFVLSNLRAQPALNVVMAFFDSL